MEEERGVETKKESERKTRGDGIPSLLYVDAKTERCVGHTVREQPYTNNGTGTDKKETEAETQRNGGIRMSPTRDSDSIIPI
mmetsp:Transcript_437/g.981  ORF Transcript_437/g.981 Transcript_437/m.981 type:complete len:82 (-) Transcript_437:2474-2719(-)